MEKVTCIVTRLKFCIYNGYSGNNQSANIYIAIDNFMIQAASLRYRIQEITQLLIHTVAI